jgi:hypothetical protein
MTKEKPHLYYITCAGCGESLAVSKFQEKYPYRDIDLTTDEGRQTMEQYQIILAQLRHPKCLDLDIMERAELFASWIKKNAEIMKTSGLDDLLKKFEEDLK